MYTCIIYRDSYESRQNYSPSRVEIVYSQTVEGLRSKLVETSKSFWEDVDKLEADYPEYRFLYNGAPIEDIELFGLAEILNNMLTVIKQEMDDYLVTMHKLKEQKANEERLANELKAKAAKEAAERDELARLMAKYGS